MNFIPTKDILKKNLNQRGLIKAAKGGLVCSKWDAVVEKVFKNKLKDQTKAVSYKDGELKIAVVNPSVGQELQLRQAEVLKVLNNELDGVQVDWVKIVN